MKTKPDNSKSLNIHLRNYLPKTKSDAVLLYLKWFPQSPRAISQACEHGSLFLQFYYFSNLSLSFPKMKNC